MQRSVAHAIDSTGLVAGALRLDAILGLVLVLGLGLVLLITGGGTP